ncbi:MAG: Sec-independent protein translocase subunit TatA [Actinomycetota bacterium]|nr:Sec-independent protein translocase subunit TatA [Actinomycetota bacterium]
MEFFTPGHLVVIAVVALVLFFGWKQLPDMARSVGRSLRVFKTEIKGLNDDDKARDAVKDEPKQLESKQVDDRRVEPKAEPQPVRAQVVRNAAPVASPAQGVRSRPRPAPSPNGRAGAK